MLTFKLISFKDGFYHYEIYPEGKVEGKGTIIFNPETEELKKRVETQGSPYDIAHFFQGVTDKNGNLRESGMVAWG